jgi:phosphoenolpyruvate-protein kinase (PTS system EI component)
LAAPILLGFGLDEFSMNPPAIPAVKEAISRLTVAEAEAVAEAVLELDSAEAVREYVRGEGLGCGEETEDSEQ